MAEFTSAKKENKGFKKTLYAYQLVSKLPNGFGNNGAPVAFASYHVKVIYARARI